MGTTWRFGIQRALLNNLAGFYHEARIDQLLAEVRNDLPIEPKSCFAKSQTPNTRIVKTTFAELEATERLLPVDGLLSHLAQIEIPTKHVLPSALLAAFSKQPLTFRGLCTPTIIKMANLLLG